MPQKLVKPALMDPIYSVSVFDATRKNEFGEPYCVGAAISQDEVECCWADYLQQEFGIAPKCIGCGKNEVALFGDICDTCGKQADEGYEAYLKDNR